MSSDIDEKFIKGSTTLDFSITPEDCPANEGLIGNYFKLTYGKPYRTIVRKELIRDTNYARKYRHRNRKNKKCIKKRTELATFIQIADIHIIDATSPSRASFLYLFVSAVPALADAFRPYEAFSTQVAECMVRKINSVKKGPHLGKPIEFVVNTSDNADALEVVETVNYINILDGKKVIPNPATPGKYVGVQDDFPSVVYDGYYHPNPPPAGKSPDAFKRNYGYPQYPGILDSASKPFKASGLNIPWFSGNGNHDSAFLGNYSLGFFEMRTLFEQIATGTIPDGLGSKLIDAMTPFQAEAFVQALKLQDATLALNIIKTSNLREIPRSDKRLPINRAQYISIHLDSTLKPGPTEIASNNKLEVSKNSKDVKNSKDAKDSKIIKMNPETVSTHGFTLQNVQENTLYYTFEISEKVSGIMLDSCNPSGNLDDPNLAPNGSIGSIQLLWLEKELRKRHSSYLNELDQIVKTNNKDKLVIVFSHHTSDTLNNIYTSPTTFDNDPIRSNAEKFIPLLHRFPNVICWVNSHLHLNRILPFPSTNCYTQGFWEVNTASHIDYPQQSRIIEVAENSDDTISIFTTLIDHQSPPNVEKGCFPTGTNANCCNRTSTHPSDNYTEDRTNTCNYTEEYSIEEMASISRELSYNNFVLVDTSNDGLARLGNPKDRNTELLLFNPLKRNWC